MCGPPGTPQAVAKAPRGTAGLNHTLRFHVNFGLMPLGKTAD